MITTVCTLSVLWTVYELGRLSQSPPAQLLARDDRGRAIRVDILGDERRVRRA